MLEQLVGTLYRQPMFAQFEAWLHEQLEAGQALSSSDLTDYYYKLNQDYYGPCLLYTSRCSIRRIKTTTGRTC